MTQTMEHEVEEVEGEEVMDVSGDMNALAVLNKSEIDVQISTAKKFPRSIGLAQKRMIEMATLDQDTARACGYALKRTDKNGKIVWIEGPSIRMAEIAVSCWGNLRYGARIVEENDRFIVAQGVCYDLEVNVFNTIEVRRRITNKYGKKYGDDMVGVTANAACAIAQRNAVFKVIPRAIINVAYEKAMRTASGDEKTFTQRRLNAVAEFKKLGLTTEELLSVLGKPANGGIEDIDTTDLRRLHGLLTAITDGETTVDAVFRPVAAEQLQERLKQAAGEVTKRPVSDGQKFEPAPEAVAEAAQQAERKEPDTSGTAEPQTEPGKPLPAPDVSTWATTMTAMESAMQDAGAKESDIVPRIHLWLVARGAAGGKEDKKTTPAQRAELVEAVRSGKLAADGKVIYAAKG